MFESISVGGVLIAGAVLAGIAILAGYLFWQRRRKIQDKVIGKVRR